MMMLEHEAKKLLDSVRVPVPRGIVVRREKRSVSGAPAKVAQYPVAVKAQVRSGGRGKQGGVVKVEDAAALAAAMERLFAMDFGGEKPEALFIEPWLAIDRELYLAALVDRATSLSRKFDDLAFRPFVPRIAVAVQLIYPRDRPRSRATLDLSAQLRRTVRGSPH